MTIFKARLHVQNLHEQVCSSNDRASSVHDAQSHVHNALSTSPASSDYDFDDLILDEEDHQAVDKAFESLTNEREAAPQSSQIQLLASLPTLDPEFLQEAAELLSSQADSTQHEGIFHESLLAVQDVPVEGERNSPIPYSGETHAIEDFFGSVTDIEKHVLQELEQWFRDANSATVYEPIEPAKNDTAEDVVQLSDSSETGIVRTSIHGDESDPPLVRFRTRKRPPHTRLSITDLLSNVWCEQQFHYILLRGFKKRTKVMKAGTKIHEILEKEVHTFVPVTITTKEDKWGLRIWNMLQGIISLKETGLTRELEVWGKVEGVWVAGVIDEISVVPPTQDTSSAGGTLPRTTTRRRSKADVVVDIDLPPEKTNSIIANASDNGKKRTRSRRSSQSKAEGDEPLVTRRRRGRKNVEDIGKLGNTQLNGQEFGVEIVQSEVVSDMEGTDTVNTQAASTTVLANDENLPKVSDRINTSDPMSSSENMDLNKEEAKSVQLKNLQSIVMAEEDLHNSSNSIKKTRKRSKSLASDKESANVKAEDLPRRSSRSRTPALLSVSTRMSLASDEANRDDNDMISASASELAPVKYRRRKTEKSPLQDITGSQNITLDETVLPPASSQPSEDKADDKPSSDLTEEEKVDVKPITPRKRSPRTKSPLLSTPSQQRSITTFFTPENPKAHPNARPVYLADLKTRFTKSLPKSGGSQSVGTSLQLMLYHRILTDLIQCQPALVIKDLCEMYQLSASSPFSDSFVAEISGLMSSDAVDLEDILAHNSLEALFTLYHNHLLDTISEVKDDIAAIYRWQQTSEIIGHQKYTVDKAFLDKHIREVMSWWKGERETKGVEVEEAWKCASCEFNEDCEWRLNKMTESLMARRRRRQNLFRES